MASQFTCSPAVESLSVWSSLPSLRLQVHKKIKDLLPRSAQSLMYNPLLATDESE